MFAEVFIVGLLSGISPGPDFAVVMRNSLSYGWRAGIASALGIGVALSVHVTYTVLGFAIILRHLPLLFQLVQLLGAAYLFWLGLHAICSKPSRHSIDEVHRSSGVKSFGSGFRDGFLCNLLNPKAALFFLSIFSQFLTPRTPHWMRWVMAARLCWLWQDGLFFCPLLSPLPPFEAAIKNINIGSIGLLVLFSSTLA
jgi:threonine/homoserine/homoserine lactone efflux protein